MVLGLGFSGRDKEEEGRKSPWDRWIMKGCEGWPHEMEAASVGHGKFYGINNKEVG